MASPSTAVSSTLPPTLTTTTAAATTLSSTRVRPLAPFSKSLVVLHATRAPPTVDANKLLKTLLLLRGRWRWPRVHRWLDVLSTPRWSRVLRGLYVLGACLAVPVPLFPVAIGRYAAVIGPPLMLPSTLVLLLHLRADVVALLLRTFEFWFSLLSALLSFGVYAAVVRDARALTIVAVLPGLLFALLADASVQSPRFVVLAFAGVAALLLLNVVVLALGAMDDTHAFAIVRLPGADGRAVSATSVLTQGFLVVAVTQLRHAYTRRAVLPAPWRSWRVAAAVNDVVPLFASRCVLLSTPLEWTHAHRRVSARLSLTRRPPQHVAKVSRITLRAPGHRGVLDAHRVLLPRLACERRLALVHGLLSLCCLSTCGAFVATTLSSTAGAIGVDALCYVSAASALLLNAVFVVAVWQPDVLRLLYASFDVLFVLAHLLTIHLCVAAMCGWDARAALVLASLLLLHWALLVDAVAPPKFSRLPAPSRRWAVAVLLGFLAALLVILLDLFVLRDRLFRFENPVVLWLPAIHTNSTTTGTGLPRRRRRIEARAVSFLLSRLPTVVAWLLRILWRLTRRGSRELVMLRGPVEFEDLELHQRVRNTVNSQQQLLRSLQTVYAIRFGSFSAFVSSFANQPQQQHQQEQQQRTQDGAVEVRSPSRPAWQ
ncbi:hypothetical protein PINS_up006476 [Pythium insidiosum]|nr:hypothetical protein PINS_up006476 [Pythium insidiosum]